MPITMANAGIGPFSPSDIAGLQLWLTADSLALANNDPVTTWADLSGNANNAAQSSASLKPLFKTNIVNSKPVVRFDGSNDYLIVTRNAGLEPVAVSIFMVYRANLNPGTFQYMYAKAKDSTWASWGAGSDGSENFWIAAWTATTGKITGTAKLEAETFDGVAHIDMLRSDGSNLDHYFDGTALAAKTAVGDLQYGVNDLWIGSYGASNPTLALPFDLCESLIYDTALSTGNRQSVETYLRARWATP